jgi:putative membrane protein insertion efficiency factor
MKGWGEATATEAETEEASSLPADLLWAAGRPARAVLLGLLHLYRSVVSAALGPRCRFYPSCSAYAEEAVRVHGAAKGLVLAVWRVLRCSPLSAGGVDPVPPRGSWRGPGNRAYDDIIHPGAGEA